MPGTIHTRGATETAKAFRAMSRELERDFLTELRFAGEIVRDDAARRLWEITGGGEGARNTSARYRVRVRRRGSASGGLSVVVDNPLKKVTGLRFDWGPTQMRVALEPALEAKGPEIEETLEHAVDALPTRYGF